MLMSNNGFIQINRQMRENWIWDFKKPEYFMWWMDILMEVRYKPSKIEINHRIVEIPRGSFRTSKVKLSNKWMVDRRRVDRFLKILESDGMIELQEDNYGTTVKVLNYSFYQDKNNVNGTADGTADGTQKNKVIKQEGNKEMKKYGVAKQPRFTPPSLEDVTAYCQEGNNNIDPQAFIAFYASKNWMIGSNKMKCWKSAIITWEKRSKPSQPNTLHDRRYGRSLEEILEEQEREELLNARR